MFILIIEGGRSTDSSHGMLGDVQRGRAADNCKFQTSLDFTKLNVSII